MGVKDIINNVFKTDKVIEGVGNIIDNVITSKEEKELLKLELQKEINRHTEESRQIAIHESEILLKDVQSARQRDIEANNSQSASWLSKNISPLLAIFTIVSFYAINFIIIFLKPSQEQKEILFYTIGLVSGVSTMVVSYYFGSSQGSKEKQDILNRK
jgi:hypothetical protein